MLGIDDVKALLTQADERTLSLFVDISNATQENQASVPAWKIWIKNHLDEFAGTLDSGDRKSWQRIREQVDRFVQGYSPSGRTLVIFASESDLTTYELPINIEANELSFGRPQVSHLLWMIDEYEPYLLVLVDQERARFFTTYLGTVGFQGGLDIEVEQYDFRERDTMNAFGPGTDATAMQGSGGAEKFEAMLAEHRDRFYRQIAERAETMQKQSRAERIIIGGSEASAHAVRNHMSERVKQRVVGVMGIPMHETTEQILQRVQPMALEYERYNELELVSQVIDFAKSGGRGALGSEAVAEALEMQRVETLVLIWPSLNEQRDNELAFRTLQLNGNVELVHGDAASLLHAEGGVAARLYYAL